MEQNPFYPSENASSGSNKDKKSEGLNIAKSAEPSYEPRAAERAVPAAPALERVISLWDRQAEEESRRTPEESISEKSNSDEEKETEKKKNKDSAKTQPVAPVRPVQPFAEVQTQQEESSSEKDDESEAKDQPEVEATEAPNPVTVVRSEALDGGENPADDTHASRQASTPRFADTVGRQPQVVPVEAPSVQPRSEYIPEDPSDEEDRASFVGIDPAPVSAPQAQANLYPWPNQAEATPAYAPERSEDEDTLPTPPQPVAVGGGAPPNPPSPNYGFANQYMHPGVNAEAQYDVAPSSPNVMPNTAPVMPIEHPLYASNRDPGARQAAAILGVGLWAEHRGRKKADRRLEKADERTQKLIEQQNEATAISQRQTQEGQRQFTDEQARQAAEMSRMRQAQERFAAPPIPPSEQFGQQPVRQFESAPSAGPAFPGAGSETRPHNPLEQLPGTAERAPIPVPAVAEQQNPEQPDAEQGINLSHNQHVEHSAWHNIVVDDRGHEVAGAIEYGEGFKRERQQEIIRDRMGDGSQQSGAAGPIQQDSFGPMYPGALPSGMTNPALPQGKPTHVDPQHQLEANNKPASNMSNPWFWIMIILIIAAFFTAALV